MSLWLRGFARRVDPEPWIFVAAAGLTVLVALLTVCAHSYVLAGVRPVSALRHE